MAEGETPKNTEGEAKPEVEKNGWEKFREFVRDNRGKITAVFTAVVAYLAGDGTFSTLFQAVWTSLFGA